MQKGRKLSGRRLDWADGVLPVRRVAAFIANEVFCAVYAVPNQITVAKNRSILPWRR